MTVRAAAVVLRDVQRCKLVQKHAARRASQIPPSPIANQRSWNKSSLTRWFITATFHDQHRKYFRWNFCGYTTIWDFICGTVRPKYLSDFDQVKARASGTPQATPATASSD